MEYLPYLILVLAFLGLFGLIESLIMLWSGRNRSESKRLKQRLQIISGEIPEGTTQRLKRGAFSANATLDRFLKQFRRLDVLDTL